MVVGLACAICGFCLVEYVFVIFLVCVVLFVAIKSCFEGLLVCVLSNCNSLFVLSKLLFV